jgi:hypothetical protein
MKLFNKKPDATIRGLEKNVKEAKANHVRVVERLELARTAHAAAEAAARDVVVGDDPAAIDRVTLELVAAGERLRMLTGAEAVMAQRLADAEHELTAAKDKALRAATSTRIEKAADELEALLGPVAAALEKLHAAADECGLHTTHGNQLRDYIARAISDLPAAVQMASADARWVAVRTISGEAAATYPVRPPEHVDPVPEATSIPKSSWKMFPHRPGEDWRQYRGPEDFAGSLPGQ